MVREMQMAWIIHWVASYKSFNFFFKAIFGRPENWRMPAETAVTRVDMPQSCPLAIYLVSMASLWMRRF